MFLYEDKLFQQIDIYCCNNIHFVFVIEERFVHVINLSTEHSSLKDYVLMKVCECTWKPFDCQGKPPSSSGSSKRFPDIGRWVGKENRKEQTASLPHLPTFVL